MSSIARPGEAKTIKTKRKVSSSAAFCRLYGEKEGKTNLQKYMLFFH